MFELERRGAGEVVAIDLVDPRLRDSAAAEHALRFIGDRVTKRGIHRSLAELALGDRDIVGHDGEKVAGCRLDDGRPVARSARARILAAR